MMNTRIGLSLVAILATAGMMTGATFAFFSDQAQSSNNTFGAGTLNLQIANPGDGSFSENVTATFNVNSLIPGGSEAKTLSFNNGGNTPITEVAMGLTTSDLVNNGNGDIRDVLNLRVFEGGSTSGSACTGGTERTSAIETRLVGAPNGTLTLNELSGKTYDSLALALAPNASGTVCLQVTMDPSATDIYQGDSVKGTFTFTAHQDASQ